MEPSGESMVRAAPGLVRTAAVAWWNAAEWAATGAMGTGARAVRAAAGGEAPTGLLRVLSLDATARVRSVLGISEIEERLRALNLEGPLSPGSSRSQREANEAGNGAAVTPAISLRQRGEELMRRSADVRFHEDAHPAYTRILADLAPDEGRILRLLATEGEQPAVDVRAGLIPLNATTELIAPGLTMMGAAAGCRHLTDVPAYLNNLFRLGLVWFSREAVKDPLRYQVLEAQPEVIAALREGGRGARTVRRSIELTPFGKDFCELCLPLHGADGTGTGKARPAGDQGPDPTDVSQAPASDG